MNIIPSEGEGFYWVRVADEPDVWQVAKWAMGGWWVCGSEIELNHADFPGTELLEVGRRIVR